MGFKPRVTWSSFPRGTVLEPQQVDLGVRTAPHGQLVAVTWLREGHPSDKDSVDREQTDWFLKLLRRRPGGWFQPRGGWRESSVTAGLCSGNWKEEGAACRDAEQGRTPSREGAEFPFGWAGV